MISFFYRPGFQTGRNPATRRRLGAELSSYDSSFRGSKISGAGDGIEASELYVLSVLVNVSRLDADSAEGLYFAREAEKQRPI